MSLQPDVMSAILDRIAAGESVRAIARDPAMPAMSSIFKELSNNPAFAEQYARACEIRADAMFEEMFEIADDGRNDWMEFNGEGDGNSGWRVNGEHVQRSKLRLDTRKWALARMNPKKYGDRVTTEHAGSVTVGVSQIETVIVDPVAETAKPAR